MPITLNFRSRSHTINHHGGTRLGGIQALMSLVPRFTYSIINILGFRNPINRYFEEAEMALWMKYDAPVSPLSHSCHPGGVIRRYQP